MTATENNVAAQAGDEPMQAAFWRFIATLPTPMQDNISTSEARGESLIATAFASGYRAAQVSPHATADVERDGAITLLRELLNMHDIAETYASGAVVSDEFQDFRDRVDSFIATTKPGA